MLKCCLNPKIIVGVLAVIAIFYFFAPQLLKYSGLLIVLICPLSMVLMMAMMNKNHDKSEKVFACPECGLGYKDAEWAKKCATWCKEHHSCNLEITEHAVKQ